MLVLLWWLWIKFETLVNINTRYISYKYILVDPERANRSIMSGTGKELTVDVLQHMSPYVNGKDVVAQAARNLLVDYIKQQGHVEEVFFHGRTPEKCEYFIDPTWFDFHNFATLYACQALYKSKDPYSINKMVDGEKVEAKLKDIYESAAWKKLGFALYTMLLPDYVKCPKTKISLRDFMKDDGEKWASQLSDKMINSQWIYSLLRGIVKGQYSESDYNKDMNIYFLKLHLLDPKSVFPTFHHLQKALPDLNLELVTTNYLGGAMDWKLIKPDIDRTINIITSPQNASRLSLDSMEIYYGVTVTEFIMGPVKDADLWTGEHPSNKRVSHIRDRCIIL